MSEIKRIMDFFGVSQLEGNVRGEHMATILKLLKDYSGKRFSFILRTAPLFMGGMARRYLRENYLEGFIELGIIKIYQNGSENYYKWFGDSFISKIKDIKSDNGLEGLEDLEKQKPKEEIKEGCCPNCGKTLNENMKYCNEDCLRKYLKKKKGK